MDWLKLSENTAGARYIADENDRPINLFGMARSQACCATELINYGGAGGVCAHFKALGCNIIRLAVHLRGDSGERGDMPTCDLVELCGGYNRDGINKFIDTFVEPDVRAIKQHGMYIQLDLHDYPPVQSDREITEYARRHYIPVWRELAARYVNDPCIAVYEIWNEPYPADVASALKDSPEWIKAVREFYIDAVAEIRKTDKRHIIMASDYNAGWGKAWDNCWREHLDMLDTECRNTCFSIHVSDQQLDKEYPEYGEWLLDTAEKNNACLYLGEIETEGGIQTVKGIENLTALLEKSEDTHHIPAVLWRPHDDETNYVRYWQEFAKRYTRK